MLTSRIYLFERGGGGEGGETLTEKANEMSPLPETLTTNLPETTNSGQNQRVESNENEGDRKKKRQKIQGVAQVQGAVKVQNFTRLETVESLKNEKSVNSDADDLFSLSESLRSGKFEEGDSEFEPSDDFEHDSDEASEADGSGFSKINKGMEKMGLEGKEGIGLGYHDSDFDSDDLRYGDYSKCGGKEFEKEECAAQRL
jgi:hypothetical protein